MCMPAASGKELNLRLWEISAISVFSWLFLHGLWSIVFLIALPSVTVRGWEARLEEDAARHVSQESAKQLSCWMLWLSVHKTVDKKSQTKNKVN